MLTVPKGALPQGLPPPSVTNLAALNGACRAGEHTRAIHMSTPSAAVGGLMRFAQVTLKCLGWRAVLPPGATTLCKHCKPREAEYYARALNQVCPAPLLPLSTPPINHATFDTSVAAGTGSCTGYIPRHAFSQPARMES